MNLFLVSLEFHSDLAFGWREVVKDDYDDDDDDVEYDEEE
jgi:hypothetical protein